MKKIPKNYITVVDIGSTKICTIIAEKKINETGEMIFQVKGIGITTSDGMEKGSVIEMAKASNSISRSIEAAEKTALVKASNIHLGIAGSHIKSCNFEGNLNLTTSSKEAQREISAEDIRFVIDDAKRVARYQPNYSNLKIIHAIPHYFCPDNHRGIPNPLGMEASRLSARVHIVFANETIVNNIIRCFKIAGYVVNPDNIVLEPIASAYAVLNKDQKDLGAIMIDIGGGTTDIAIYYHNSIRFSVVIPYGGAELTRKLSEHLMASPSITELIKIAHGNALKEGIPENEEIEVQDITGKGSKCHNKKIFCDHIQEEMTMLVHKVFSYLNNNIRIDHLKAGIYLTGGAALLKNMDVLIHQLTHIPCTVCSPNLSKFKGHISPLEKPQFSTAIGIFLYVLDKDLKMGLDDGGFYEQKIGALKSVLKFVKSWFI
jgi:cell division protein FtsA